MKLLRESTIEGAKNRRGAPIPNKVQDKLRTWNYKCRSVGFYLIF